ncbi:neutral zinc metallopeptidase [Nonomuraea rhizosphaerae]|uniref:neutral zinc metallopeptidase n=1 Tax=Nonomuraea rhizosphaerae TaxID=2665663 RepID=UPI001C5E91F2|nr:neutral zinc metallopeptidase [Nonomuraea rhizosphaerae]
MYTISKSLTGAMPGGAVTVRNGTPPATSRLLRLASLLSVFLLSSLFLTNAAQAASYPIRDRSLTANALYDAGELQATGCREKSVKPNNVPSTKKYLTSLLDCLNASWAAYFEQAGLPFTEAGMDFVTTKPRKYCGWSWGSAQGVYCGKQHKFRILLNKDVLDEPSDLFLFVLVAHEYGHHVQYLSGIDKAYRRHPYKGDKELNEQSRRMELQAECLAGVFVGSSWPSLDRSDEDWWRVLDIVRASGDEQNKVPDHGKGRNAAAWLDKGFQSDSPASCNTWSAPSSKVS